MDLSEALAVVTPQLSLEVHMEDPVMSSDSGTNHSEAAAASQAKDAELAPGARTNEKEEGDRAHDQHSLFMLELSSDESLQDSEDIDFEFVYALHTFVATVEGQANATKGDTMVLLDDSNSYWWLVRIVKDSSIGYLPAEHIETPTERLARLNKHRNIDVSNAAKATTGFVAND